MPARKAMIATTAIKARDPNDVIANATEMDRAIVTEIESDAIEAGIVKRTRTETKK